MKKGKTPQVQLNGASFVDILIKFFFEKIKESKINIPIVTRQTEEPIKLVGLNRKPIKIRLKERIAKIVVNGNHFT